jgi:hypothetical protein
MRGRYEGEEIRERSPGKKIVETKLNNFFFLPSIRKSVLGNRYGPRVLYELRRASPPLHGRK